MTSLVAALGLAVFLEPLVVPTPSGPKLHRPDIKPPPASLMLQRRPLQMQPSQSRPSLNVLPPASELSPSDGMEEPLEDAGRRPALHLEHR
jgi:hypothetical protein